MHLLKTLCIASRQSHDVSDISHFSWYLHFRCFVAYLMLHYERYSHLAPQTFHTTHMLPDHACCTFWQRLASKRRPHCCCAWLLLHRTRESGAGKHYYCELRRSNRSAEVGRCVNTTAHDMIPDMVMEGAMKYIGS